jgi:hypothetical protein
MDIVLKADGSRSGDQEMEEQFATVLEELFVLFCSKQKSYGRGNISKFGERGILIRSNDKIERLIRMVWREIPNPLESESIEDTWKDLSVYAAIALLCKRGRWI